MIVQFKEEFLEVLKEYGTGIRITTAFVGGSYKKFDSLWNGNTLTFTIKGGGEKGPIVVYYSDYNDNKIGKAFILGTYTAESCPEHEKLYVSGKVEQREDGKYLEGIRYEGSKISEKGVYLVTKSMRDGAAIFVGEAVEDKEDEELILTTTNYFNIKFPEDTKANILSTYADSTIKFLEDPYQIEGCNIFKCDSEIPTKESYEKHYRRQVLSYNTIPMYLDARGEKVHSSVLYRDYKSLTIQAVDVPYADSVYYVENSKTVTITGSCVYDVYRVENGTYTLIKENEVGGIDQSVLKDVAGNPESYEISDKQITFTINSNIEKSSFQAFITYKDELRDNQIKTLDSNVVTFVTYLGWSVEYSSNLKDEETGNIVFVLDAPAGSGNLLGGDARLTLYSGANVDSQAIRITSEVEDYFNFDIRKDTSTSSEQYKYTVNITTKQPTEVNGKWFPIDASGNSNLMPCILEIDGSSDRVTFYCVQRAKYPLRIIGNTILEGYGAKATSDLIMSGQEIGEDYSGWDYEIEGDDTLVDLYSGKKIGDEFNIISRKNPGAPVDKIKFFRVGPSGEVVKDSWKDIMYCYEDNSIELPINISGESLGINPYSYNDHDLFIFERGNYTTSQEFDLEEEPEKIKDNDYFEFKWKDGKVIITPKELKNPGSSFDWYPKDKETGDPILFTIGEAEFYCVVGPDLNNTTTFLDSREKEIKSVQYRETGGKEVFPVSTVSCDFNYWRPIGLDSRVGMFYSRYANGIGVPFDGSISLETQYQAPNSRDIKFEPFVIERMAGRYPNAYDYFADWKNQLVSKFTASLPLSIVGKSPSEVLQIFVYNPDGSMNAIQDDEYLDLDYIGLYKIFIKSTSAYRISIKGVVEGKQYFYFFNTLTDSIRDGVLSIDKGSFNVISGEEVCFAFYGNEPGCFTKAEQILDTYIQVEDLSTGETINIRLKRTYPDNNLRKVKPTGTDMFVTEDSNSFDVSFQSNVETNVGIPVFTNSLFSAKGEVTRKLVTSEIWIRGYKGHSYVYVSDSSAPERYPVDPADTLSIINPEKYNGKSLEYNIYRFPTSPGFVTSKDHMELPYASGGSDKVTVKVREDGMYRVFYQPTGSLSEIELTPKADGSYYYRDSSVHIYKNTGEDVWNVEEVSGVNYGDATTQENAQVGSIIYKSYVDKDHFINGRSYTQDLVDSYVPGVRKSVAIIRLCMKNSVSSIIGDNSNIIRTGETRTYDYNFTTDEAINLSKSMDEQVTFIDSMKDLGDNKLEVIFRSRLDRDGYSRGISKSNFEEIKKFSDKEKDSSFYVYEGESKVYFNNIRQNKWERGIRIAGDSSIASPSSYGTIFLGKNDMITTDLSHDDTSVKIYVSSVLLDDAVLSNEPQPCTIEVEGGGSYITSASLNQSSYYYGYPVTIYFPTNDSYDNTAGPYDVKISDSYGNEITKRFYVKPNNSFSVVLAEKSGDDYVEVTETAFSASGENIHPTDLYVLTDAPVELSQSFSVESSTVSVKNISSYYRSSSITLDVRNYETVTYNGSEYTAYKITSFIDKISSYSIYGSGFNAATDGFGHINYDSNIIISMYCNGGYSSSNSLTGHHGFCEVELIGPYKTYFYDGIHAVDFDSQESPEETSKYSTNGSYFMSNVRSDGSGYYRSSTSYSVNNNMYIIYVEKDPRKYDTEEKPFNSNGYYAGFKIRIKRKEYFFSNDSWKVGDKTKHKINSVDSLLLLPNSSTIKKNNEGEDISVPSYLMAATNDEVDMEAPDGSGARVDKGSITTVPNYDAGFLYAIASGSFSKTSNKNSCYKTFTLTTEGIPGSITFTVNFEIYI